ncbi:MAG: TnpV protein [Acetanaerobacterium sp.]
MSSSTYLQKDSLYYPNIPTENVTDKLGKYGLIARRYLLENRFDLFEEWLFKDFLDEFLLTLDIRYETWKAKMVQSLEKSGLFAQNGGYMNREQQFYQIQEQAETFVEALLMEELKSL